MRKLGFVLAVLALLGPFAGTPLCGTTVTEFEGGGATRDIHLIPPRFNGTEYFPVPNPGMAVSGALNVSTLPGPSPLGPRIDIGGDGTLEWEFNASLGPFGRQDRFSDGKANFTMSVSGTTDTQRLLSLPKGASVSSASLELTGTPEPPGLAQHSRRNNVVYASQTSFDNVTGIPQNASGVNATVTIESGKKTVPEQEQTNSSGQLAAGYIGYRQSVAQTFTPYADGELAEVQLFVVQESGFPGSLSIEIRTADENGTPTPERISTTMTAPQNSVYDGVWNAFSFQGVQLLAGRTYAVVLYARSAQASGDNSYRFGANLSDNYQRGAAWTYPDGSAAGSPVEVSGADLAFRAVLTTNLTAADLSSVSVNGNAFSGPDERGHFLCEISEPAYSNGSWPLGIRNDNAFDLVYLNWSARAWYQCHVDDVLIDIANDGTVDWSFGGKLDGTHTVSLPAEVLDAALARSYESDPDVFGITTGDVLLEITALGTGLLEARNLNVAYNLTLRVLEFRYSLRDYLAGKPPGTVRVPVVVSSSSEGNLRLCALSAIIDTPPELVTEVPSTLAIPEDGSDLGLYNISSSIRDDIDTELALAVVNNTDPSRVLLGFNGSFLTAKAISPNWTGRIEAQVEATDDRGQKVRSNVFTVTVTPVNDAPEITSFPPNTAGLARNFTYQVRARDAENDTLSYALDRAPAGMAVDGSGLVSWVPAQVQPDSVHDVTVNVSDGELWALQDFRLTVVVNNHPPTLLPPAPLNETAYIGKPYFCQFRAHDLDAQDVLTFTLELGPQGMVIDPSTGMVSWPSPVEGNYSVRVKVSDGIDLAAFTYDLRGKANSIPAFTSKPVTRARVGEPYSYQLGASDADSGSFLIFVLREGPGGMTLEPGGRLDWTPSASQKGRHRVEVSVSDGVDNATQVFDIEVSSEGAAGDGEMPVVPVVLVVVIAVACAAGAAVFIMRRRKGEG